MLTTQEALDAAAAELQGVRESGTTDPNIIRLAHAMENLHSVLVYRGYELLEALNRLCWIEQLHADAAGVVHRSDPEALQRLARVRDPLGEDRPAARSSAGWDPTA